MHVLDLARVLAGPYAAMLLGDLGAEPAGVSAGLFGVIGVLSALVEREHQILNARLALRTVADWLDRLRLAGVPAGELKTLDRVYESEQVRAENLVWEVDHPRLGGIRLPGNPVHYSRSTVAPGLPPPTLGEHTDELRAALPGRVQADGR